MITYAYRYKIKPTQSQIRQFEQYLSICRSVYNFAHAERKAWIESRKCQVDRCSIQSEYIIPAEKPFPNYNIQAKALTEAKKKLPHLKLVNAQCLQQVLRRLDKAWTDFFRMPNRGFPRFRNANRYRSFKFPQPNTVCLDAAKGVNKLAYQITQDVDNIFVEDIDFKSWSKGLFCKQSLDSGIGGFINTVLPYVAWKQGKFYLKVDKNGTSQECCKCHAHTGKKELGQRTHICTSCGHTEPRDTCSAKVIQYRGERAVGHTVQENACGGDATGIVQLSLFDLVGNQGSKNLPLNCASN